MSCDLAPRLATPADVQDIRDIVVAAYTPWITIIGQRPGPMLGDYALFVKAGEVHLLGRGLIVLKPRPDHLLFDNVAVHPDAQGQGLGGRLMAFAEGVARQQGYSRIRLYSHAKMDTNIARYSALGYVVTHRITERGLDRIYMEKHLSDFPDTAEVISQTP